MALFKTAGRIQKLAGARRERSVRRHRQGCRPAVLKFAGASSAGARYGSPAFISKLTAVVNSSQWFAKVHQGSPALLSGLLSKLAAGGGILTIHSPRHQKDHS